MVETMARGPSGFQTVFCASMVIFILITATVFNNKIWYSEAMRYALSTITAITTITKYVLCQPAPIQTPLEPIAAETFVRGDDLGMYISPLTSANLSRSVSSCQVGWERQRVTSPDYPAIPHGECPMVSLRLLLGKVHCSRRHGLAF